MWRDRKKKVMWKKRQVMVKIWNVIMRMKRNNEENIWNNEIMYFDEDMIIINNSEKEMKEEDLKA